MAAVRGEPRNPRRASHPARAPTTAATGTKASQTGLLKAGITVLLTAPVNAPAAGPASDATRMFPSESRYRGSRK